MHTKIIVEGGINHNGDLSIAKKLIDVAVVAGCDYIKWQKRNPDLCVPEHQKSKTKSKKKRKKKKRKSRFFVGEMRRRRPTRH